MKIDKAYTLDFTTQLLNIDSPTGYTHHAIEFLKEEATKLGYCFETTAKGNLTIEIPGESNEKVVGCCAHTDTLGLMVRSIKSNGRLALTTLGGPQLNTLDGEYCRIITRDQKVYTGTILSNSASAHVYKDASSSPRDLDHMEVRIDEVVKNAEDVKKLGINHGDIVCIQTKTEITESGFIKSRFLDDKLSVGILYGVMKYLSDHKIKPKYKTYVMITTYEEVGHGNSYIPADITELLGVDMGCIGEDLACSELDVSICAKDSSGPYDYHMTSKLIENAKALQLPYAVDIYPMYGPDVSAALRSSNNIKGALIGPGVHASHGMERSHYSAVEASFKLILSYLCE